MVGLYRHWQHQYYGVMHEQYIYFFPESDDKNDEYSQTAQFYFTVDAQTVLDQEGSLIKFTSGNSNGEREIYFESLEESTKWAEHISKCVNNGFGNKLAKKLQTQMLSQVIQKKKTMLADPLKCT